MENQRPTNHGAVAPPTHPEVSAGGDGRGSRPGSGANTTLVVLVVVLAATIVAGLAYFLVLDDSDPEVAATEVGPASTAAPASTVAPAATPVPTVTAAPGIALAPCVNGEISAFTEGRHGEIALYQQTLTDLGYDPGEVDGFYGPNTSTAAQLEINDNGNIDGPNGGFEEYFPDEDAVLETVFVRLGIAC